MKAIDANVLLYAYNSAAPEHEEARRWLEATFASEEPIGLPLQAVLAFLRISTRKGLLKYPRTVAESVAIIDDWLAQPHVSPLRPGVSHWTIFESLCRATDGSGDILTDAHIAAIAIEHDATLFTCDRDFARFSGLRWVNPLN